MDDTLIRSWRDVALFVAPMIVLLVMSFFRVDAAVAASRRSVRSRPARAQARPFHAAARALTYIDGEERGRRRSAEAPLHPLRRAEENLSSTVFRCRTTRRLTSGKLLNTKGKRSSPTRL